MKYKPLALCWLLSAICAGAAHANWQYPPYDPDAYYYDDGGRFTLAIRGGGAYGFGSMQNDLGALTPEPFWTSDGVTLVGESYCGGSPSACLNAGFSPIGQVNIANLPVKKSFSSVSWIGGVGIGWVLSNNPSWRIEANWDHIAEAEYNSLPLYEGTVATDLGQKLFIQSGGVSSTVSTEIFSAMFYYDFYNGCEGPKGQCKMIPYVGVGLGYASSKTVMSLTDIYGDLSGDASMQFFGVPASGSPTLDFYTSETRTGNIALSAAAGLSYGLSDNAFLDFGLRVNYLPRIKWELNNAADASAVSHRAKDMFSAKNVVYGSLQLGVRFEF
ncbi:MAG: hypothetical protein FWC61_02745 [Proteobacteria bacterium]|nr:hypothetical protein [Pseudomonadota bacterium]